MPSRRQAQSKSQSQSQTRTEREAPEVNGHAPPRDNGSGSEPRKSRGRNANAAAAASTSNGDGDDDAKRHRSASTTTTTTTTNMRLTSSTVYQGAARCSYAVRGNVVQRAMDLERQGRKIVYCNIGNPQSLGQKPLTFLRQVLALVNYPDLLSNQSGAASKAFPADALARARKYIAALPGGSTGSYTHSAGIREIREEVAEYLLQRDQTKCDPDDLFLTDGASSAANMLLRLLIRGPQDGVLIPTPRYPLYSALLDLLGGASADYYLDEESGWQLSRRELERAYDDGKKRGLEIRALVVVNPGNPTGQVMSASSLRDTVDFCRAKNLVLIADEVYQENVWRDGANFVSFKRVVAEMGVADQIQLASLHSVSKGFFGECGRRGGFVELSGFSRDVRELMYKMASVGLCSNVEGQLTVGIMCNPPKPGDESYALFCKERDATLQSLKRRAAIVGKTLNYGDSLSCQQPEGALYAFPRVELPPKFVAKFKTNPDEAYCLQLLDETGIVLVPGSGFGQREGSHHFRVTILPPEEELAGVMGQIVEFHKRLVSKWA